MHVTLMIDDVGAKITDLSIQTSFAKFGNVTFCSFSVYNPYLFTASKAGEKQHFGNTALFFVHTCTKIHLLYKFGLKAGIAVFNIFLDTLCFDA